MYALTTAVLDACGGYQPGEVPVLAGVVGGDDPNRPAADD
jgi:hypothetical protein